MSVSYLQFCLPALSCFFCWRQAPVPTADTLVPAAEPVVCVLACAIRISVQHMFMSLQVLMLLSCVSSALLVTLLFFHCPGTPISGPACNFGPAACVCVCVCARLRLYNSPPERYLGVEQMPSCMSRLHNRPLRLSGFGCRGRASLCIVPCPEFPLEVGLDEIELREVDLDQI